MNAAEQSNAGTRRLVDAELELVIDGALAPERAGEVDRTLETSSTDAARLDELRAADASVRAALLTPPMQVPSAVSRRRVSPLIAAAMLIITGVALLLRTGGTSPSAPTLAPRHPPIVAVKPSPPSPPSPPTPPSPPEPYEPVRIVLSIPAPNRTPAPSRERTPAVEAVAQVPLTQPASEIAKEIASSFGDASDAGIRRAVSAINDASPEDRAAALTTLGQTLRSGSTAVRILDKLGPRDQVAVCSELALDASLRAVALQRLRDLTGNPDVGADARAAVRALAAAPGMTTWLRSYGLLEDPPKPTSLEGSSQSPALG